MSIEKLLCTDSRVESLKKLNAIADEVEAKLNADLDNLSAAGQTKFDTKANKATTLAGYGITNAYSKTEVDRLLDTKADEATTLAGYGITDAYTKNQANSLLNTKVNVSDMVVPPFVNKNGDTMSGTLEARAESFGFIARSSTMDITQTPTANKYIGYEMRDKNNARCAYIGVAKRTDGTGSLDVQFHGVNRLNITSMNELVINGKNVPYIKERVVSGTSWYEVWSDGWIAQGGQITYPATITFLKPFANTGYTMSYALIDSAEGYEAVIFTNRTTTSMEVKQLVKNYSGGISWYACGK